MACSTVTVVLASHFPPPQPEAASPWDWASPEGLGRIFAGLPVQLTLEEHTLPAWFPSPEEAVGLFETRSAHFMAARTALEAADRWADARGALVELFLESAVEDGEGCRFDLGYVVATFDLAVGRRQAT